MAPTAKDTQPTTYNIQHSSHISGPAECAVAIDLNECIHDPQEHRMVCLVSDVFQCVRMANLQSKNSTLICLCSADNYWTVEKPNTKILQTTRTKHVTNPMHPSIGALVNLPMLSSPLPIATYVQTTPQSQRSLMKQNEVCKTTTFYNIGGFPAHSEKTHPNAP